MLFELLIYAGLGAVVGFLAGLLGVGGGGILVPVLAYIFAHKGIGETHYVQVAVATSLACMLPTTLTSAITHHKKHAVYLPVVKHLAVGSVVGAYCGAKLAVNLPPTLIAVIFTVLMLVTALQLFTDWQPPQNSRPLSVGSLLIAGFLMGSVSALISLGGAFLMILFLSYQNIAFKQCIGTAAAISFFSVSFATVSYLLLNTVTTALPYSAGWIYLPALTMIMLASLILTPLGVSLSHRLANKTLKRLLGVICVLLSVNMVFSTF